MLQLPRSLQRRAGPCGRLVRSVTAAPAPTPLATGLAILGISEKGGKASLPWYTFFISSWSRDTAEEAAGFYRCGSQLRQPARLGDPHVLLSCRALAAPGAAQKLPALPACLASCCQKMAGPGAGVWGRWRSSLLVCLLPDPCFCALPMQPGAQAGGQLPCGHLERHLPHSVRHRPPAGGDAPGGCRFGWLSWWQRSGCACTDVGRDVSAPIPIQCGECRALWKLYRPRITRPAATAASLAGRFAITLSLCPSLPCFPLPKLQVNGYYNRALCRNRNPFRWAEYAVSASLMQVMIAQLCGEWTCCLLQQCQQFAV